MVKSKCNDCGEYKPEPLMVMGTSVLANGVYYDGPEICQDCITRRREAAIAAQEYVEVTRTSSGRWYVLVD